jgi:xylulokinase
MAGAGDQPAGFLGAGFLEAGQLLDVSGSTTLLCCSVDTCNPDTGRHAVMYMPSIIKGKYTAFSYINGGGITLKWFRDELASGVSWDDLTRKAATVPPGSEGLLFVPYFGGRQCPYNAELRGSWIGLNWGHRKEHMFRSLLEGLSYDYALGLENITGLFPDMQVDTIEGTGGGSANTFWNQMKADIMNKGYKQLKDYQFPLRGCGLIVGYSLGIYTNLEKSALEINKNNESIMFNPNPQHSNLYAPYFEVFKKTLISPMDSTMHDLFQASVE